MNKDAKIIQSEKQLDFYCSGCEANETPLFCGCKIFLHEFVVDWGIAQMFECPCYECLVKSMCSEYCVDYKNYAEDLAEKEEYYYGKRKQDINNE